MDELVKSVLDELELRYVMATMLNIMSLIGAVITLYLVLKRIDISVVLRKSLRFTIVVIGLVVIVIMLQSIFDFSYAIQTLKTVFESIIYETGQKSV